MAFRYSDKNREEYYGAGYTVLRDLIPPSLLADLRHETDKAREIARAKHGAQAQRLQPVYAYEELKSERFRDFLNLPGLQDTVRGILTPEHKASDIMGVLLEPAEKAWCTHWHRDWGYNVPGIDIDAFFKNIANPNLHNQLNAALYDDHSLWFVPHSHDREDSAEERAVFPVVPPPPPDLPDSLNSAERELACLRYTRQMPGAVPVLLFAGDCAFYRSSAWHIGNYVPYLRRATLHDGFYGPEDRAWQASVREMVSQRRKSEEGSS